MNDINKITLGKLTPAINQGNLPGLANALPIREAFEVINKENEPTTTSFRATLITKEELDEALFAKSQQIKTSLSADDELLENYGKKHGNLVRMERLVTGLNIPGFEVPTPHGISTDDTKKFLEKHHLCITSNWETLHTLYVSHDKAGSNFLERDDVKAILEEIKRNISEAFDLASKNDTELQQLATPELLSWIDNARAGGHYLMVRSTGAEDTRKTANAGGNTSCSYVAQHKNAFAGAAKTVICSYFEYASLHNLIAAGVNPFESDPKLAVTAQKLIGEEPLSDPIQAKTNIERIIFPSLSSPIHE